MAHRLDDYLRRESSVPPIFVSPLQDRLRTLRNFSVAQHFMANPALGNQPNLSFFNILEGRKIESQNRTITKHQRNEENFQSILEGNINDCLAEDANEILQGITTQAQLKFLQLFFDAYMAPRMSDMQWRLGPVTGTVMDNEMPSTMGSISNNSMYTRSNFSIPVVRKFWSRDRVVEREEVFTSMFFPPYKIGIENGIQGNTSLMNGVRAENPEATFDLDNFSITRDGFTYRDPGFKPISDFINYIQWVAEGVTGIVSTYLTEWDLSVYMQENLLMPLPNGGPKKMYLNYRIREDNPLSSNDVFTGERALVFNVAGSAVSKLFFDCQKIWRPSDHPWSSWWTPYMRDLDWSLKTHEINNEDFNLRTHYMDIYDNVSSSFPYDSSSTGEIIRHQDFVNTVLSISPNFTLKYFQAFYFTHQDTLTDYEVKLNNIIEGIRGADPGEAEASGLSLDHLIAVARREMLVNGGYHGYPTAAGLDGGWMDRMTREDAFCSDPESGAGYSDDLGGGGRRYSTRRFFQKMRGRRMQVARNALRDVELSQLRTNNVLSNVSRASQTLSAGLNNRADASSMSKSTGINRYSPALFGGPHGSSLSPNTIQGYFESDNINLRNVPRINPDTSFLTPTSLDDYEGSNRFYDDGSRKGDSIGKSLGRLVHGMSNYTMDYFFTRARRSEWIRGTVKWNGLFRNFGKYVFPQTRNGESIRYSGDIRRKRTETRRRTNPWERSSWWYNWTAYYNIWATSMRVREGNQWFWVTVTFTPYRLGTFYVTEMRPFKNFLLHDMPGAKWSIVHHSFNSNNNDNSPNGFFWRKIRSLPKTYDFNERHQNLLRDRNEFVLSFYGNKRAENEFMNLVMGVNRTSQRTVSLFFLQGNENRRFVEGPEAIFKADCTLRHYQTYSEEVEYRTIGFLFWRRVIRKTRLRATNVPYVSVDMGSVSFFADRLNVRPKTNRNDKGVDVPVHLRQFKSGFCPVATHPIQKFTDTYFDNIISHIDIRNQNSLRFWNGWSGWRNFSWPFERRAEGKRIRSTVGGAATVNINAPVSSSGGGELRIEPLSVNANGAERVSVQFSAFLDGSAINPVSWSLEGRFPRGTSLSASGFLTVPATEVRDGDGVALPGDQQPRFSFTVRAFGESDDIRIRWVSRASMGISGVGIISSTQGLDPPATDITKLTPPMNMHFRRYMAFPEGSKNAPIKSLAFRTNAISSHSSHRETGADGTSWWIKGGMPIYSQHVMDAGLREAIISMNTRLSFFSYGEDTHVSVPLDVPIRNFLSTVIAQLSSFEHMRDNILPAVSFEVLNRALTSCVDKCVLKASGMKADGTIIEPDRNHPLYNYWLSQAVAMFGNRGDFNVVKTRLKSELNRKITSFERIRDLLAEFCLKQIEDCSFSEIQDIIFRMEAMKGETRRMWVDNFLFAYLQILYNYRFFFISKRFNKEDGTMWIMRALESVVDLVAPFGSNDNPPPSPRRLGGERPVYKVSFFELQNTTSAKRSAIIHGVTLEEDRITTLYVRVMWATREDYDRWAHFDANRDAARVVPEVVEIHHETGAKYAFKPADGLYKLFSAEYIENDKNVQWNRLNPQKRQRVVFDFDECVLNLTWGNSPVPRDARHRSNANGTPIRWDVFGKINVNNVLEYSQAAISPHEFVCLCEEGADFWTIYVPRSLWPRSAGYRTDIKLEMQLEGQDEEGALRDDPYVSLLGPMAYTIYPITNKQERPVPGIGGEVPRLWGQLNKGVDGFDQNIT